MLHQDVALTPTPANMPVVFSNMFSAAAFAVLGALLFILVFVVIDLLTPGKLWEVIVEKHNTAGAILVGSVAIAMGIIIAAAIH